MIKTIPDLINDLKHNIFQSEKEIERYEKEIKDYTESIKICKSEILVNESTIKRLQSLDKVDNTYK